MALLEIISKMKEQGKTEPQIISELKEEGFSPRQINEAVSQSHVKSAVSGPQNVSTESGMQEMQPSIMQPQQQQPNQIQQTMQQQPEQLTPPLQQPMTQEMQQPEQQLPFPQEQMQQPYPQGQAYTYPQYETEYTQSIDPETITEIASQLIDERLENLSKQISEIQKIKTELNFQVQKIENRLARVENIIDNLQIAIIKKIGEQGENIKNIADEMHETQKSFGKILNPLTDNIRELQEISSKQPKPERKTKSARKSKTPPVGFEDYLR